MSKKIVEAVISLSMIPIGMVAGLLGIGGSDSDADGHAASKQAERDSAEGRDYAESVSSHKSLDAECRDR